MMLITYDDVMHAHGFIRIERMPRVTPCDLISTFLNNIVNRLQTTGVGSMSDQLQVV